MWTSGLPIWMDVQQQVNEQVEWGSRHQYCGGQVYKVDEHLMARKHRANSAGARLFPDVTLISRSRFWATADTVGDNILSFFL